MSLLGAALLLYAHDHDGKLPPGRTMLEVYQEIAPYITGNWRPEKPYCCSLDALFERHPEPYSWNADVAGKSLDELRALPSAVPIISCRHFIKGYSRRHCPLYSQNLLDAVQHGTPVEPSAPMQ